MLENEKQSSGTVTPDETKPKVWIVKVYNTFSGRVEPVEVSKAVYDEYRRDEWRTEKRDGKEEFNTIPFTKQSSEIAYKITELRTTRRKILSESENAETIDELSELNAALMESESTENFDKILFENIVKRIFVINNACIKFSLLGGLEATEKIKEKERCKNRG